MRRSRWILLALVLAIATVVVVKEAIKGKPTAPPAVQATAKERATQPSTVAAPRPPGERGIGPPLAPKENPTSQRRSATPAGIGVSRGEPGALQPTKTSARPNATSAKPETKPGARTAHSGGAAQPRTGTTPQSAAQAAPPRAAHPDEGEKTQGPLAASMLAACLKSGRPTVADFGKGWCRPCKMMVPVLEHAAARYAGKANVVYVDMEAYPQLAEAHRIAAMPTQIFFDAAGKEVGRHMGYLSGDGLDAQLAALGVKS